MSFSQTMAMSCLVNESAVVAGFVNRIEIQKVGKESREVNVLYLPVPTKLHVSK